jgi:hypothetical protein
VDPAGAALDPEAAAESTPEVWMETAPLATPAVLLLVRDPANLEANVESGRLKVVAGGVNVEEGRLKVPPENPPTVVCLSAAGAFVSVVGALTSNRLVLICAATGKAVKRIIARKVIFIKPASPFLTVKISLVRRTTRELCSGSVHARACSTEVKG